MYNIPSEREFFVVHLYTVGCLSSIFFTNKSVTLSFDQGSKEVITFQIHAGKKVRRFTLSTIVVVAVWCYTT